MRIVLSAMVWAFGMFITVMVFIAMLLAILITPLDRKRRLAHAQCFWWSDILVGVNPFWKIKVSGLENIDKRKTYVMVVNHQSMADIVILYKIKSQFKWIAKESLFKIPFFGWCMSLAKHIKLSRGTFGSIKKVYRQAAKWLRDDMSVMFFPEGTRSETSDMGDFLNGAFKLAIKEKKPILPIVLHGIRDAIPKGSWIFSTKLKGSLEVLPEIDTASFKPADFGKLKQITRRELEGALLKKE